VNPIPYLLGEKNIGNSDSSTILQATLSNNIANSAPSKFLSGASASHKEFKVDDKVRVKQGAVDYNGTSLSSFVFTKVYDVIQVNGDRVVIGIKGVGVTIAVKAENLTKI